MVVRWPHAADPALTLEDASPDACGVILRGTILGHLMVGIVQEAKHVSKKMSLTHAQQLDRVFYIVCLTLEQLPLLVVLTSQVPVSISLAGRT